MMAVRQHRKHSIWLYYGASVAIILIALLLVTLYVADRFRDFFSDHLETVLEARARSIGLDIQAERPLPENLEAYCLVLKPTDPDIRVTVVDSAGTVLCDSEADPAQMGNHRQRPEIMAALNGHTGSVIRFSNTVRAQLLYVAVLQHRPDSKPWVVRTALPLSSIEQLLGEVFHTLLGVLLVLVQLYFKQLEVLKKETKTIFEKIESLFLVHFILVKKMPNEMALILSPRPAKLTDPDNIYTKNTKRHKRWLKSYIGNCLKKGIDSGEFNPVQVKETTSIIIMMLNEILQKKDYKDSPAMRNSIIDFWRRILLV